MLIQLKLSPNTNQNNLNPNFSFNPTSIPNPQIKMFSLLLLLLPCRSIQPDDGLLEVDDMNFTDQLEGKEALVLFYDPLCPGSNPAYFDFYKTFQNLKPQSNFVMAKFDMYSNIHIATAFQIYTSPSLLYYKGNDTFLFQKEINSKNLAFLIDSILDPKLKLISPDKLNEFLRPELVSFILLDEENSALSRKIMRSTRARPAYNIAHVASRDVAIELGLAWGKLHAVNLYHGIRDTLNEYTYETITDFVAQRDLHKALPLVSAYDFVIEQGLPAVYIFRNESQAEAVAKVINETLNDIGSFRIVFADLYYNPVFSRIIGLPAEAQPCFMLIEPVKNNLFKYVGKEKEVTKTNILKLIEDWKANKAQRYYKTGPRVDGELNGSEFQKYVENTVSDTLVHFSAPWCDHCAKLDEAIELAKKNGTDVKVVRLNAEDNEVPEHVIDEYPVLKFFHPVSKKWTVFTQLAKGTSDLQLWERIVNFVKLAKKDKRSPKPYKAPTDL